MGLIRLGNKPPLTVAPEDTVVRAARAMTERRVGAATVLEGTGVVGVVTERDVMEKVVAAGGTIPRACRTSCRVRRYRLA